MTGTMTPYGDWNDFSGNGIGDVMHCIRIQSSYKHLGLADRWIPVTAIFYKIHGNPEMLDVMLCCLDDHGVIEYNQPQQLIKLTDEEWFARRKSERSAVAELEKTYGKGSYTKGT